MTALDVECPICHVLPGKPCTAPTETTARVIRRDVHMSREEAARG